jgi:CheY-like chemotaxis protein
MPQVRRRRAGNPAESTGQDRPVVTPSSRTVLVVDDQAETLASVRLLLEREGYRVLLADGGPKALALLAREPVQVMLVDYFMPGMNGESLIRAVRARDALVRIILHTGHASEKPPREMLRQLAIQGYHDKSDGPERLLLRIDFALKSYDQMAQLRAADRLKTELLASVSHEFRTPLNIIIGYVDLLREGAFGVHPPEGTALLERVRSSAAYLNDLVDEFLDVSRL